MNPTSVLALAGRHPGQLLTHSENLFARMYHNGNILLIALAVLAVLLISAGLQHAFRRSN